MSDQREDGREDKYENLLRKAASARKEVIDVDAAVERLVVFRLGEDLFCAKAEFVKEIIPSAEISRVPFAPSHVLGVFNLRGAVMSLIDVRAMLGAEPSGKLIENYGADRSSADAVDYSRYLIVEAGELLTGVAVDEVMEVGSFEQSKISPFYNPAEEARRSYLNRELKYKEGQVVMMVDFDKLFEDLRT